MSCTSLISRVSQFFYGFSIVIAHTFLLMRLKKSAFWCFLKNSSLWREGCNNAIYKIENFLFTID